MGNAPIFLFRIDISAAGPANSEVPRKKLIIDNLSLRQTIKLYFSTSVSNSLATSLT